MKKLALLLGMAAIWALPHVAQAGYADDRAEIENLSNRYIVAVDAGDIETVMDTWAEEGRLVWVFGDEHGKAAVRKAMSGFVGGAAARANVKEGDTSRPRTRHQIINHVIDVAPDGKTAHTIAYWFAFTNDTPQHDVQILYFGHYEDDLVKENGKWLFLKRVVYNESQQNRKLFYPGLGETDPLKK